MSAFYETPAAEARPPLVAFWQVGGIYYAEVEHPAFGAPIRVALHGVSTHKQAEEAVCVLAHGCVPPRRTFG